MKRGEAERPEAAEVVWSGLEWLVTPIRPKWLVTSRILGKEYFDVFYGIDPLAWASCGFAIVYFGAALKNAAQKYNKPVGQAPPKVGGFVGKEVENREPSYKA